MKNPGWHDVKRNKPVCDAYIDEPLQDLILIATWTLFKVVQLAEKSLVDQTAQRGIEALADDVNRASSYTKEKIARGIDTAIITVERQLPTCEC
jgi:hypothetical protein